MKQYYIISLRHTSKGDTALTFWGPNGGGYTYHRDRAGLYNEDIVDQYTSEDNVKIEKEKVDPFWMNAVDFGDRFIAVANTPAVRKAIGITDKLMKPKKYAGCRMAFMNTPVLSLILFVVFALASCKGCGLTTHHEVRRSPDGKDSVASIMYFDGKQYNQFYIPFPAFKTVFESGGYEGCYEYYLDNELPLKVQSKYATYK